MGDNTWRVVIGCDEAGFDYKERIKADLLADPRVAEVIDVGVPAADDKTFYPKIGIAVGEAVAEGRADRGIIICGTGMGMAMAANKVKGIRASTAHDSYSVERLVLSNDGQVLCMGQRVIGIELARRLAKEFLNYRFDTTSASAPKVAVITEYESGCC